MTDFETARNWQPPTQKQVFLEGLFTRALKLADIRAVFQRRSFNTIRTAFYRDMWKTAAENIDATISLGSSGLHKIQKGDAATFVYRSDIMLDNALTIRVMADKGLTYRLLAAKGLPVPNYLEFGLGSIAKAEKFLADHRGMVVIKPATGTGTGMGVTTAISTVQKLRQAARYAASFNRRLLVEPHLSGRSYRLLYLDGVFLEAICREPPQVTGDGRSSIRHLIRQENKRRKASGPTVALHPIIMDGECRDHLENQGLKLSGVPGAKTTVVVKGAVNENSAKQNYRVSDAVHSETIAVGAQLVNDLGVRFAGVDLITDDITAPFSSGGVTIGEINVNPGIHHHYLVNASSETTPAAERILSHLFEKKRGVMRLTPIKQGRG